MVFSWKSLPSTVLDVGLHSLQLAANSPETWRLEEKPFLFGFLPILRGELLVLGRVRVPPIFVTMVLSSKTKDPSLDMGQVCFSPFQDAIVANKGLSPNSRSLKM